MLQNGLKLNKFDWTSETVDETFAIGFQIADTLKPGSIVALSGDLGSGKTTLVKGIIHRLLGVPIEEIHSPTFTYCVPYESPSKISIFHFDLYRIKSAHMFLELGLDEFFYKKGVCLIEWSEKIESLLPRKCDKITLLHVSEESRKISYEKVIL